MNVLFHPHKFLSVQQDSSILTCSPEWDGLGLTPHSTISQLGDLADWKWNLRISLIVHKKGTLILGEVIPIKDLAYCKFFIHLLLSLYKWENLKIGRLNSIFMLIMLIYGLLTLILSDYNLVQRSWNQSPFLIGSLHLIWGPTKWPHAWGNITKSA